MPLQQAVTPPRLDLGCRYVADVLAAHAASGAVVLGSRELEYATRRLARAARETALPDRALITWLGVASASAFGGTRPARELAGQMAVWALDELAAHAKDMSAA